MNIKITLVYFIYKNKKHVLFYHSETKYNFRIVSAPLGIIRINDMFACNDIRLFRTVVGLFL